MSPVSGPETALGLDGFTFADLHRPARLRELYLRFVEHVKRTEPELWLQWQQYREVPESLSNIARSNIIVAMAPHVSRFVSALFGVGPDAEALIAQTRGLMQVGEGETVKAQGGLWAGNLGHVQFLIIPLWYDRPYPELS